MNCKNCTEELHQDHNYCASCGAEVVNERISSKRLMRRFANDFFGFDNRYLVTLVAMTIRPGVILFDYLHGVRKKYVNPFTFLAIGSAVTMLIMNEYSQYSINDFQNLFGSSAVSESSEAGAVFSQSAVENSIKIQKLIMKYFNFITFLILPFYAFIAYLVYRKPYNYAEHLVINCYIQGYLFLLTLITFLLGYYVNPLINSFSFIIAPIYYLYTYGKLYKYGFWKTILKFLLFFAYMIGFTIVLCFIMIIGGILYAKLFM
ncbi:DUF3667 domain-containing protein [Aureivirga sp. CE67]|uniref:DUF3667 domain-containing protein n=1 Tax=Aureivirga sp. CE67 TaxID=1788983 RepID=UPI0018C94ACB|nr:DUF3667 domain-containing protein [Aureivirga sp. CE67]